MKRRTLLRRILDKLKPAPAPPGQPPSGADQAKPEPREKKSTTSSFEPLENRIAPATLVNSTTVTFKDLDGDLVTVKFSKPVFTGTAAEALLTAQAMFTFKNENGATTTITGNNNTGEQLQLLALDDIVLPGQQNPLDGASFTIIAKKQGGLGDDLTNVGHIRASTGGVFGFSLGDVVVDGDLGRIEVGNPNSSLAIKSLTVQSIGAAGLTTQAAGGSLQSTFTGQIKKLVVKGDVVDAILSAEDGLNTKSAGKFGSIVISGALKTSDGETKAGAGSIMSEDSIGSVRIGMLAGGKGTKSGRIEAGGKIGNITITGDIRGGEGDDSGTISATKGIGNVTLGGSLWAGEGDDSGQILSQQSLGAVAMSALRGDQTAGGGTPGESAGSIRAGSGIASLTLTGDLLGGSEDSTGFVKAGGPLGPLKIGGSITGGDGANSGTVNASQIGAVTIGQLLTGGMGDGSGSIRSDGSISKIKINNSVSAAAAIFAGKGTASGAITAGGTIGGINIGGTIDASADDAGEAAGSIFANGSILSLQVLGALKGGDGAFSGSIATGGSLGAVKILGNVGGGAGDGSGSIAASGKIASISVTGSLTGGSGADSGGIIAGSDPSVAGDIGKITVTGGITGGDGLNSGSVRAIGQIGSLTIGSKSVPPTVVIQGGMGTASGSIFSATGITNAAINGHIEGGSGLNSASIFAEGAISKLVIAGDLRGGNGADSAAVRALDRMTETGIVQGALGNVLVGAITGGGGDGSAQISADGSLGKFTAASITGGAGAGSAAILAGVGQSAFDDDFTSIGGAKAVTVTGAVTAGTGAGSANIEIGGTLKKLAIGGALTSTAVKIGRDLGTAVISGPVSGALVSAFGQSAPSASSDLAIGKLTVNGNVNDSVFLAGYDSFGFAANGNAQVGTFTVKGDWTASSLAAGVADVNGDGFGNDDDTVIAGGAISAIASIVITGKVTGSPATGDQFGFVARTIAQATISGVKLTLLAGKDTIPLAGNPQTDDTTLREVP